MLSWMACLRWRKLATTRPSNPGARLWSVLGRPATFCSSNNNSTSTRSSNDKLKAKVLLAVLLLLLFTITTRLSVIISREARRLAVTPGLGQQSRTGICPCRAPEPQVVTRAKSLHPYQSGLVEGSGSRNPKPHGLLGLSR